MNDKAIWNEPYIAPGIKEPPASFETFTKHYVDVSPEPTIQQLAEVTGQPFKKVERWKYRYKYRERRTAKQQYEQHQIDTAAKRSLDTILPILTRLDQLEAEIHQEAIQDTHRRIQKINKLPSKDPNRTQLLLEEQSIPKTLSKFKESLQSTQALDDYKKQAAQDTTVLNELLEKVEDSRTHNSLNTTHTLYEEYQDEEY